MATLLTLTSNILYMLRGWKGEPSQSFSWFSDGVRWMTSQIWYAIGMIFLFHVVTRPAQSGVVIFGKFPRDLWSYKVLFHAFSCVDSTCCILLSWKRHACVVVRSVLVVPESPRDTHGVVGCTVLPMITTQHLSITPFTTITTTHYHNSSRTTSLNAKRTTVPALLYSAIIHACVVAQHRKYAKCGSN